MSQNQMRKIAGYGLFLLGFLSLPLILAANLTSLVPLIAIAAGFALLPNQARNETTSKRMNLMQVVGRVLIALTLASVLVELLIFRGRHFVNIELVGLTSVVAAIGFFLNLAGSMRK